MVDANKKKMTTIQVEREVAEMLKGFGRMGDTYSAVIRRLMNGRKGDAHDYPREAEDEHTGSGGHQRKE